MSERSRAPDRPSRGEATAEGEAAGHDGATPAGGAPGGREVAARLGVDVALLEMLVCPLGGGPLVLDGENGVLVSRRARLAYPIRDGVPILVPAEATPIDEHDARLHPRGAGRREP